MTDVNHFAVLNNYFAAPDDEPLRFVDVKREYIIHTNQQSIPNVMMIYVTDVETSESCLVLVGQTAEGHLALSFTNGPDAQPIKAPSWLVLAETLDIHPDGDSGLIGACSALFRQVGGDSNFTNHFRLELNWKP
jgi:hypothetical protein